MTTLSPGTLTGIEQIDMTGGGTHTLVLDAQRVREISDTDTLRVRADAQDRVFIGSGWTPAGLRLDGGELFSVLTQGGATLLVTNPLVGDFDGDQVVARPDVTRMLARLGTSSGADRTSGDLNGDGRADLLDLAELQRNLGRQGIVSYTAGPAAAAAVVVHAAPANSRSQAGAWERGATEVISPPDSQGAPWTSCWPKPPKRALANTAATLQIASRLRTRVGTTVAPATDRAVVELPVVIRARRMRR